MAKLASKTYGEALFELVLEKGTIDEVFGEVAGLRDLFAGNAELDLLLTHPKLSKEDKTKVLEQVFKGRISDDMLGFLVLVVEKGRYGELLAIFDYFIHQVKEYKKIGVAVVTGAYPVTDTQKRQIEEKLLAVTDYTSFEMEYRTDPSLIGGVKIQIGDRVVDGTVRNLLAGMAKALSV